MKNNAKVQGGIIESSNKSKMLKRGNGRNLYKLPSGDMLWLDEKKYLDECIIKQGIFEEESTKIVEKIIKKGDVVLDIGANIGYYTVMFSRLVGEKGKVFAFEPTCHYGEVLQKNITQNEAANCIIKNFGLSNKSTNAEISIGTCSATMHWASDSDPCEKETIKLCVLDEIFPTLGVDKVDFIKIDVDGHESKFFGGAWKTLDKFDPAIILEVNQENYLDANCMVWDFYDDLKKRGYHIYRESDGSEFKTKRDFLIACANFAYSANVIISRKILNLQAHV